MTQFLVIQFLPLKEVSLVLGWGDGFENVLEMPALVYLLYIHETQKACVAASAQLVP